ncbi:MAG TPA: hemerythrin domain-containing protein [Myxococcota bacterium]|jgi:hypothetical protein|nr:hemerythrin domain-containing protein [Myxococcota bacterium]
MRPSDVRACIIEEHQEIRRMLGRLDRLAHAAVAAAPGAGVALLQGRRALAERLRTHIDLEDEILVPALRTLDAWGAQRAEAVTRHHAEQRRWLTALLDAVDEPPPEATELVRFVRWIGDVLREDMDHEERDLLHADLLRDDPVGIDVQTG